MIDLDRPPVADRDLPDPSALRAATFAVARETVRSPRRPSSVVVALVAAALVATVLVGVLRQVTSTPQVAAPVPAVFDTDAGPASAAQVRAATRRCVSYFGWKQSDATLFARRVVDGTAETTALVLRLTDGRTVHCRQDPVMVPGGELVDLRPTPHRPAVVVGGVDSHADDSTGTTITHRTAVVLRVSADVARVEVVAAGLDWPERQFLATPHAGWVYVPVAVSRQLPLPTEPPSSDALPVGKYGGAIPVDGVADPTLVVTAYDAQGRSLFVQTY